ACHPLARSSLVGDRYADARIGIGGAVVGLVAGVAAALVAGTGALVTSTGSVQAWSLAHFWLRPFISCSSVLLAERFCWSLGALFVYACRRGFCLSLALICRSLRRCASSSSSGPFSSRLSIEALALTGALSTAWVWPLTIPASAQRAK